jgi:hypothetical protein
MTEWMPSSRIYWQYIYVNKHAIASNHYLGAYKHLNFHIIIVLSCAKWFHSKYIITALFNKRMILNSELRCASLYLRLLITVLLNLTNLVYAKTKWIRKYWNINAFKSTNTCQWTSIHTNAYACLRACEVISSIRACYTRVLKLTRIWYH